MYKYRINEKISASEDCIYVQGKPNKYDCPICGRKGIIEAKFGK